MRAKNKEAAIPSSSTTRFIFPVFTCSMHFPRHRQPRCLLSEPGPNVYLCSFSEPGTKTSWLNGPYLLCPLSSVPSQAHAAPAVPSAPARGPQPPCARPWDGSYGSTTCQHVQTETVHCWARFFCLVARSEKLLSHKIVFLYYTTTLKAKGQRLLGLSPLSRFLRVRQRRSPAPAPRAQELGAHCALATARPWR